MTELTDPNGNASETVRCNVDRSIYEIQLERAGVEDENQG
jgi:hypothetical protein